MMWLSTSELIAAPGLPASRRGLLDRAAAENWRTRPRPGRGRTGSEYLFTDLPEETQQALAARMASGTWSQRAYQRAEAGAQAVKSALRDQASSAAIVRWGQHLEESGGMDPVTNPRMDLLQRLQAYRHTRGEISVWAAIVEFSALWSAGEIEALPGTRAAYPSLPPKTLDKWYRAWITRGAEALIERKPRRDKGSSQLGRDADLHAAFVAALAEIHDPTARQVARVIREQLGAERTPPERTLRTWLAQYRDEHRVALLKLKNPDGWRNKYMPAFGSRTEHILAPNDQWQLDSTIADAQQRVDQKVEIDKPNQRVEIAFQLPDMATGEVRRHALVAVIDVFTRRAQVLVSRTSSANAVKALTRRAMLAWGKPRRVKTDNGKDYTATDFDFALRALQIEHQLCTPFSPEQKPHVERFLGTLLHDLFPMLPGFVGHDVAARKAIESGRSFAERFGTDGVFLRMTPEQLQDTIDGWLEEYHNRAHSELGCSPNEMAARHTTHVARIDERALDLFLTRVAGNGLRTVLKRGISVDGAWYAAPELAAHMGAQVYCRVEEDNLGVLHVFDMDGAYLCRALDHTRLGINRAELAARARAIEADTVNPIVKQLRQASRRGLTAKAVASLQAERTEQAVQGAPNVTRLAPRQVAVSTPAVDAFLSRQDSSASTEARAQAREALAQESAPVLRLDTPKQRYSTWVRLQARMQASEPLSERERQWSASYQGSAEFEAWNSLYEGSDPLEASG